MNPQLIKKDFPILSREMNGRPLVYLDNAATTQKPTTVIDAISTFYRETNANIHRGVYTLAEEATAKYEEARKRVSLFIGSPTTRNLIFTRSTTEAINLVAHSWGRKNLKAGDAILLTEMEHHANIVPWFLLAKEKGLDLRVAKIKNGWELDLEDFQRKLDSSVKLVCVTACSNVLGTINPISEISEMAKKKGALVLVDGAQSTPHMETDVQTLGCDFFAFSAHKMLGPTGVGGLWVNEKALSHMDPFQGGGEMINKVTFEDITWAEDPLKFEAGTSNYADTAAFVPALEYLEKLSMSQVRRHEMEMAGYAIEKLSSIKDLVIYGSKDPEKQGGVVSFNHKVVHAHDVGTILSDQGVAVRVGHHCAQPLMKALDTSSTVRASFYIYNDKSDVDALVEALKKVNQVFGLSV